MPTNSYIVDADRKIAVLTTLGCKVNQYETQMIREQLARVGYDSVAEEDDVSADMVVVNTCTVTMTAGSKSRQEIRRLKRKHPGALIVVTGCYADSDQKVLDEMTEVDIVVPNKSKESFVETVLGPEFLESNAELAGHRGISTFDDHTRAFIKVQDGCELYCTFCIIPSVRGKIVSRSVAGVIEEAKRLADSGYLEIVLTGIHLGAFGQEYHDENALAFLVKSLANEVPGLERLRLSSIEIGEINPALLAVIRDEPICANHLHIPLQSGDTNVLKRMHRRYTAEEFLETIGRIRSALADPGLSSDVIVGFPGETEEAFLNTVELVKACNFHRVHIFPYSKRPRTPAAKYSGQVPAPEIRRRSQYLADVVAEISKDDYASRLGTEERILVESRDEESGFLFGYTERYHKTYLSGPDSWQSQMIPVTTHKLAVSGEGFIARPLVPYVGRD
ncbi:MAG: tRNA (N(6)-L-threonylcarbamoyladenosine(37)-C(2))-methylthiotransferase MtaB [Planctomycetes bacterium]|nr:tRNA (N(6)-L-threonylcarbamoyladenosine(37)-C(2))-methylthiotransferase MtaB [Planctomycetota bacterium]